MANVEMKLQLSEQDVKRLTVAASTEMLLQAVDPDHGRAGTEETPGRVGKAWDFWTQGYGLNAAEILATTFEDGAQDYDEMVLVRDIPLYSKCEHHLADIFGTASVAYLPQGRVVGLSKISRLVNMYARRLQTQERMTAQIANAIEQHLQPKGCAVIIRARHMCMESRGICQQGHHTVTSALRGAFKTDRDTRAEFMQLTAADGKM